MMKAAKKDLYHRRRCFAFKNIEFMEASSLVDSLSVVLSMDNELEDSENEAFVCSCADEIRRLSIVEPGFHEPLVAIINQHVRIDSFTDAGQVKFLFRFDSLADLHRLRVGFGFPERMIGRSGKAFSGDEILLAGLYRMGHTASFADSTWTSLFGWEESRASIAVGMFLDFMSRWVYLVTDDMEFWSPQLPGLATAIERKVNELDARFEEGTLRVFGFIDCTQIATSRPGGGPRQDGRRNSGLLQRAFYNGWKHNHGIKFQTIDLANGMNFHVSPLPRRDTMTYSCIMSLELPPICSASWETEDIESTVIQLMEF